MSKRRSITKKINLQLDIPLPNVDDVVPHSRNSYFGEKVQENSDEFYDSSSESLSPIFVDDNTYDNLSDTVWTRSSGSSTSGSDDLETEATKKISNEYNKIEDFLYSNSETDLIENEEYEQWIETFPHLRVIGSSMKINYDPNVEVTENEFIEEIIAEHSDNNLNESISNKSSKIRHKIKESVINKVLQEVQSKLLQKNLPSAMCSSSSSSRRKYYQNLPSTGHTSPIHEYFRRISPKQPNASTSSLHHNKYEYRSPVMKSHMTSSKWQRENSFSNCSSLPHIPSSNVPFSKNGSRKSDCLSASRSGKSASNFSANSRKKSVTPSAAKMHTKYSTFSPRDKNVILPPIQNLNLDGDKSHSTTPRKANAKHSTSKLYKLTDNLI